MPSSSTDEHSDLEKESKASYNGHDTTTPIPDPTPYEKETLATYEGHDADIPSNAGFILNEQEELKRQESYARRRASIASRESQRRPKDNIEVDVEKQDPVPPSVKKDEDHDPNVIFWDGPDDPANPINWSTWLKVLNVGLVSGICFVTPLASSMFAPGVPELMAEFKSSNIELAAFVVSVYVLGFAAGPLVLAPLSEMYGRVPLYHATNLMFIAFTIACDESKSLGMLIGFRFLAGTAGSAPLTNGGGTIADLIRQEHRGAAMSIFVIGPLLGPVIGPVAGGFLAQAKGWRWVFWVLTIISGTFSSLCLIFLRETYAPIILQRKVNRLRKETGNLQLRSKLDIGLSPRDLFWRSIVRPMKMLIFSPIVLLFSIYMGVVYGYLYLLFTTFTTVFEGQYGFSSSSVGLTYLGLGIGSMGGLLIFGFVSDRIMKAKSKPRADGSGTEMKPEYRLPPMIPGAFLIPIGFFIYGWTADKEVQFIAPIFGTLLIGVGNLAVFMALQTYLVDAFTIYAASALAANTVLRSIMGAVLPLAGPKMYDTLGLGWGNSLLAFIAVALIPVPLFFLKYGEKLRNMFNTDRL